jgi:hypothetical protein
MRITEKRIYMPKILLRCIRVAMTPSEQSFEKVFLLTYVFLDEGVLCDNLIEMRHSRVANIVSGKVQ